MKQYKLLILVFTCMLMAHSIAGAVTKTDFEVKNTQSLLNLCTASSNDPLYKEAVNFCHGYLVGAFHFYKALHSGPEGMKLVCFPDPPPTRNEAINQFIVWAESRSEHMNEAPVETEFRFLSETWPCN